MNYDLLFAAGDQKAVEIAIIGVQGFNHSLFVYGSKNNRVSIRVLCGRNIQKCVNAYLGVGIEMQDIVHCTSAQQGREAFALGKFLIFDDISLAMQMPIDLVVEGTGNTEASARYILEAIEHHKHVIMVTKESDSVVGSLLARKARERGVIYSLAEGDQPALLIGLVSWAKSAGLEIVSIGKASEYDFIYDPADETVQVLDEKVKVEGFKEVWSLGDDFAATVARRSELLSMYSQRAIPDLAEMAIVCNHLPGIVPDIGEFHYPVARTIEVPDLMCSQEQGGLFGGPNRIDVYNCLRRPDEQSMEGGVYVVVACNDEETWQVLLEKGVPLSRNRKTALIYYPAHYLGFETLLSVFSVGLLGLPTSSVEPQPRYDVVARATVPLAKGTPLSAKGHHHVIDGLDGVLMPACKVSLNTQIPYYLADGSVLNCDVQPGDLITAEMLVRPEESILWSLRLEQDEVFLD